MVACNKAMLAPNWHCADSMEQQQQKVYEVFFAHNLKLELTKESKASKVFLSTMSKPNNGSKCAALPRGKILVNAYLLFGKTCGQIRYIVICQIYVGRYFVKTLPPHHRRRHQDACPSSMNVKPDIPQRNNVKDAITVPIYKSMIEHAAFLLLVKLKHQAGRVLTNETSLRHQPALFGTFTLMAVSSSSGSDITGVVTKRATDLAQGKRKFGEFYLLHYN